MTTGFSLGDAIGKVIIDSSGVSAGIAEAKRSIGQGFGRLGEGFSKLGGGLTALTAPLVAFGALGVRTAGDFDAAMRELSARTGIVGEDLERMKQAAIDAGAATVFSASDAANSLLQLTSSGLTAEEALAVLPAVMDGAAAAGANLGDTADWITDIMAAFGLETDQARYVIDSLVRAAGSGSASVADLALGFQNAGGIASMFGMSVDETAAALQIFSENGIKGAEAGTQLKSMLNNMTRQTTEVQNTWRALGISMYDVQGNMRPLNDVIQELNARLQDGSFTQEEQIDIIKTLGGSYGQLGLQALLTSDGLENMQASMANAADAATVAESKMGGWKGMLENLSGSLETFMINVLTPFMNDRLVPLGNKIADVVNWLGEWATENPEVSGTILEVIAALAILGPTLLIVGKFIETAKGIFDGLKLVIGALTSPILGVILIVLALGLAWATNFGGMRDAVEDLRTALDENDIPGALWAIVRALFAIPLGIATWLGAMLGIDVPEGLKAWQEVIDSIKTILENLPGPVQDVILALEILAVGLLVLNAVGIGTGAVLSAIGAGLGLLFTPIGLLLLFVAALALAWATNFGGMRDAVNDLKTAIENADIAGALWAIVRALFAIPLGIATWLGAMLGIDVPEGLKAWQEVIDSIKIILEALPGLIDDWLKNQLGIDVPEGLNAWKGVIDSIGAMVQWVADNAGNLLSSIKIDVPKSIKDFADVIGDIVGGLEKISLTGEVDIGFGNINPFARAAGGPVAAGMPYIVGERGPELFVPGSDGAIVPNDRLPSMGDTYNITVAVPDAILRDEPRLLENADLFGQRLAERLAAQG